MLVGVVRVAISEALTEAQYIQIAHVFPGAVG